MRIGTFCRRRRDLAASHPVESTPARGAPVLAILTAIVLRARKGRPSSRSERGNPAAPADASSRSGVASSTTSAWHVELRCSG